jgi:glutaminyl-peptide cyclotransferase
MKNKCSLLTVTVVSAAIAACAAISGASCGSAPVKARKPVAKITTSTARTPVNTSDSVKFNITIKCKDGTITNAETWLDNQLVKTGKETDFFYTAQKFETTGIHTLKVISTSSKGATGTAYFNIEVVSDITPVKKNVEIVKEYPHNTNHYTQGLEFADNDLFESTGQYGKSGIFHIDINTAKILQQQPLESKYFGEGITILNDKIYQITWKAQKGFVYDRKTLAKIDSFTYKTEEGWGLTNDGTSLIMSSGSEIIEFINPNNFLTVRQLSVYDNIGKVQLLNELEYDNGFVYANIYTTNIIVKIDIANGKVLERIDLSPLIQRINYSVNNEIDVLNGIAINRNSGKLYVTGKLWPKLFEIKIK